MKDRKKLDRNSKEMDILKKIDHINIENLKKSNLKNTYINKINSLINGDENNEIPTNKHEFS